jgi:hypothetical protein
MKKALMMLMMVGLVLGIYYGHADAISGACANCHTMHYRQDGGIPAGAGTTGPYQQLLKNDCIGCHSGAAGSPTNALNAPVVYRTSGTPADQGPNNTLAGGDFYWVVNWGATYGHNVIDVVGSDGTLGLTPPGWDASATSTIGAGQVASGGWTTQLTCAGAYGCHGKHQDAGTDLSSMGGIKGAHHGNPGTSGYHDGSTLGKSYRFLYGIQGFEDGDWEWTATDGTTDHNEYKGINDTSNRQNDGTTSYADTTTISFLCAECHGNFHSEIDADATSGSPWVRHPTDIALPTTGEYSAYTTYSVEAPVGNPTPTSQSTTFAQTDTNRIVICLSCHRAHGSNQPDLLRWKYSDMQAGTTGAAAGTGCFRCHTLKDGI